MKANHAITATLFVFVLGGCSDPSVPPAHNEFHNPYEWVGRAHNEGLSGAIAEIERSVKEIHNGADPMDIAERGLARQLTLTCGFQPEKASLEAGRKSVVMPQEIQCSNEERPFVERMRAVHRTRPSAEVFEDSLLSIERDAYIVLGEESRTILLASSVARSSLRYWKSNVLRWWQALAKTQQYQRFTVVEADTSGWEGRAASDSVLDNYLWNVQKRDWETALQMTVPCLWAAIDWAPCVLATSSAASSAFAIVNFPYWGKIWP